MADIVIRRHQSIFDPSAHRLPIHLIGCGATGSRIFTSLVELGCTNLHCYDFDVIEAHNLSNQAYLHAQIGKSKVSALAELYELKTGVPPPNTMTFNEVHVGDDEPSVFGGIVFLLVDSIAARKEIADTKLKNNPRITHVIETRMASTHGNVFHFDPNNAGEYALWYKKLPNDENTELSPCGSPISVGPTASIIANLAIWRFINLLTNPEAADSTLAIYMKPTMLEAL